MDAIWSSRNAWRLRAVCWANLTEDLRHLLNTGPHGAAAADRSARVGDTLAMLVAIEAYCAFPGEGLLNDVRTLFARGDVARAYDFAQRIHRLLEIHTYPYFEVLVVDTIVADERAALRDALFRPRRRDTVAFDIVVVPTLEDALIAARLNVHLHACVVRRGVAVERMDRFDSLRRLVDGVGAGMEEGSALPRDAALLTAVVRARPTIDLHVVDGVSADELSLRVDETARRLCTPLVAALATDKRPSCFKGDAAMSAKAKLHGMGRR